ncbi:unnamed protein product [Strongylus vulgaris]|uniref:Uncharacterized protein n=1 Tax=Strongylus vulgaris TaxID=40348 RepID=A0A3P7KI60_STRVU|nr:unnamed protein product [Strongylus vulgaris]
MFRRVVLWVFLAALLAYIIELCFYRADLEVHIDGENDDAFDAVRKAFRDQYLRKLTIKEPPKDGGEKDRKICSYEVEES